MAAIQVQEWGGAVLTNPEFRDYASEIIRVSATFNTEKIPVSAALSELRTVNQTLGDFISETRRSDATAKIAALDAKRDATYRALESAINLLAEVGDDTGIYASATHLANVIAPYKGLQRKSLASETELIDGLQIDLEKSASVNALKETGLYKIAGTLFEVNTLFKTAYHARTDERGEKKDAKDGETTASLRKKATELVLAIIATVNALNRLSSDADTLAAAKKLDAIVTQYKLVGAGHRSKKKDDPEPDETAKTAS